MAMGVMVEQAALVPGGGWVVVHPTFVPRQVAREVTEGMGATAVAVVAARVAVPTEYSRTMSRDHRTIYQSIATTLFLEGKPARGEVVVCP